MGCRRVCAHLLLVLACGCVGARGALPDAVPSDAALYGRDCSGCSNGQSGESRRQRRKDGGRPMLAYLVGVRWGRVNCAVVCACVRACASLLRACVSASHCPYGGGRNGRSSCSCAPRSIPPRRVCSARSRAVSLVPSRSMEVNYRCLLQTYVRTYVSNTALPVSAAPPPASRARTSTS